MSLLENQSPKQISKPRIQKKVSNIKQKLTLKGLQTTIADYLRKCGYEVSEDLEVIGKSGIKYAFKIVAKRDDLIIQPTIVIEIVNYGKRGDIDISKIVEFDAEAFDAGFDKKVFIGIPGLSKEVLQAPLS